MNRCSSYVLTLTFLLCFIFGVAEGANADEQPSVCADSRDASQAAYAFGLKVQKAVRERDLAAFFSLVDGELDYGPRRKYAENKAFHEIFPDSWRAAVLKEKPPCTPFGWRGFWLANNGLVRYREKHTIDLFHIVEVYDWVPEKFPHVPVGWKVDDRLLPPQCFVYEWNSHDNFQEVARLFGIPDDSDTSEYRDFAHNTGKYFGDPIYPFNRSSRYNIWQYVHECVFSVQSDQLQIGDSTVQYVYPDSREVLLYTILAEVSPDLCQVFAPNLPGKCLESYLVHIASCGGSMGCRGSQSYTIYGMFQMHDGERHGRERIIFPLKNFRTENPARNFLDSK